MASCAGNFPIDYEKLYQIHFDDEGNYSQCNAPPVDWTRPASPSVTPPTDGAKFTKLFLSLVLLLLTLGFLRSGGWRL